MIHRFVEDLVLKSARFEMTRSRAITVQRELDRFEQGWRIAYGFDPPRYTLEAVKWNRPG